jgi:hypothetical protein
VWLVPNPDLAADAPSFQLRPEQLLPVAAPWNSDEAREAGLALADRLFAEER